MEEGSKAQEATEPVFEELSLPFETSSEQVGAYFTHALQVCRISSYPNTYLPLTAKPRSQAKKQCKDLVAFLKEHLKLGPDQINEILRQGSCGSNYDGSVNAVRAERCCLFAALFILQFSVEQADESYRR